MKRKKIYLRAYFNDNLGDDLFVDIIANRYQNADIMCLRSKKQLAHLPENVKSVCTLRDRLFYRKCRIKGLAEESGKMDVIVEGRAMDEADAVVFAIGSGFMEDHFPIWRERRDHAFYKKHPYLIGCNFGPYETDAFLAKHIKYFNRCSDVCFRDSYSQKLFPNNSRYESDIVFSYAGEEEVPELFGIKYQVIVPRAMDEDNENYSDYVAFLKGCIEEGKKKGLKTVLLSFCMAQGDGKLNDELSLCGDCIQMNYPGTPYAKLVGVIKGAERVVAVRYHAVILALLYRVPVAIIAYSEKTEHVLLDIDSDIKYITWKDMIAPEIFMEEYTYRISEKRLNELKESSARQFAELDKIFC